MWKHGILTIALLASVACSKKSNQSEQAAATPGAATTAGKAAEPVAPPAPKGPEPDASKEMMGLDLQPMGAWKPTWDADAKVAKWENEGYMTGIVIRIVSDKLDTIDDLKEAAPMMMQVGTAITKVVEQAKTAKGWYAIVDHDEGKHTEMLYIQKFGSKQLVCSGNLTPRKDPTSAGGITKDEVLKACESIKVK